MEYPAAKIDRCSIERANGYAKAVVENVVRRAKDYAEDPMRNQRLDAAECVLCHYTMRAGGTMSTERPCGICGASIRSRNTDIGVLCVECAKTNGLCKHCGADIELKSRRKARPYEARKEEAK